MCGKLFEDCGKDKIQRSEKCHFPRQKTEQNINIALVNISVLDKIHLEI